jgi:hypothetical protein
MKERKVVLNKLIAGLLVGTCLWSNGIFAELNDDETREDLTFEFNSTEQSDQEHSKESPINFNDFSSEDIQEPAKAYPFSLSVNFDKIGKSKINKGFFKDDKIDFGIAYAKAIAVIYYCPAYSEGANLGVSYTYTAFKWENNPWFHQQRFNTLTLQLGGFSKRLTRWFWQGLIDVNIDMDEWNLNEYSTYDLLLWGRYEYCRHIGIHVGFIAQTGMQMDRVYPIFGADWKISKNWKLNLVFPVNISLEYILNKQWSLAIAGRSFDSRQRIHRHQENQPKSVIRYENVGAEGSIRYDIHNMSVDIHAGYTLGGKFKVANRHNNHSHSYKLDPSLYAGAEVDIKF